MNSADFGSREDGFNVLNVQEHVYKSLTVKQFWKQYNKQWLDKAIKRGDIILLATKPKINTLIIFNKNKNKRQLTGYGKEIFYLLMHGYTFDVNSMQMIPPTK